MGLAAPRVDQMFDFDLARRQPVQNEPPMASGGMPLGAHHGEFFLVRLLDEPAGPGGELLRFHVIGVTAKRFVSQSGVARTRSRLAEAAEYPAFPLIADAVFRKRALQRNAIELRMAARPGVGAHVNQQLDTGSLSMEANSSTGRIP